MKYIYTLLIVCFCHHIYAQSEMNAGMLGSIEARALGPGTMSGRITAISGVNSESKVLYIGTAGGGVWKTTNACASFKPIFDKYCQSIGAIAINQKNPKEVYVGTGESNMRNSVSIGVGMYKSTDGGENWKKIGLDSTEHISKIIVHPTNDQIIYVAVPGPLWSDSKHRGLYRSTDGGNNWEKILYKDDKTGCADILMHPTNPDILYASMWQFRRQPFSFNSGGVGSGLYKSIDGGKTWKELNNGLPAKPFGRIAMALAPSEPNKMWAIVESNNTGLYISDDGGNQWKNQSATMNICARPFYFSTIEVDPKDAKRVYRPAFEFAYSDDGGYSFSNASYDGGWIHSDMHALWIDPNNTNIMYVGTDGGVYISIDKGATFRFCHNLPVGQFYHVDYDLQEPYNIYGGLQDNGSWKAPSAAPGGINNAHWHMVGWGDGFWTVPDIDGETVYVEYQGGNMSRVNMKTMKSNDIQPKQNEGEDKLRWNWNTPIVKGNKNPKNLYVGAQYLYHSSDQGRNWKRISPDLTSNDKEKQKQENSGGLSADNTSAENHCTIFTITESPFDEKTIWVGTDDGKLQFTTNGGTTWKDVTKNYAKCGVPAGTWISSIALSSHNANRVYVTFENHMYGDHNTYLAVSNDMGNTWQKINSDEYTGFAHKICEDPMNENLLFLGTEMGLFCTVDAGKNWFRMKNNIPEYALVRDIKIHPKTNDLIVATHGRGIYILDDISVLRNLNKDILSQDVYLFPTPTITLNTGKFGGGGPSTSGGWGTGNPAFTPSINYYLKERLTSGKASIEIYDENNNLIQSMNGGKRKGINRVFWNLRGTPPKVAEGSTKTDGAGFTSPMVLPGNYKLVLKINDKEYKSVIQCVHDTQNKDLTENDRKLVYDKAMQLQQLYNNVNTTAEQIRTRQTALSKDTTVSSKKKFYNELEKVRSELMATKQKSIFADEERLREKVSSLYGTFCGMETKPNQMQLKAIDVLEAEYRKVLEDLKKVIEKYESKG